MNKSSRCIFSLYCLLWVISGHLQCTGHVRFTPESRHCSPGLTIRRNMHGNSKQVRWRTQSQSNLSPPPNSLLTGKRTGNFSILDCFPARAPPLVQLFRKVRANFPSYRNREFMGRNREFCFRNREFSPLNPKSPPNEVFGTHREKDHKRAQQKQGSRQQGAVHFPPGMRAATPSISVCNVAVITSPLTARPAHEQSRPSEFAA